MFFNVFCFIAGVATTHQLATLPSIIEIVIPLLLFSVLRYWKLVFFIGGLLWTTYLASNQLSDHLPTHLESIPILIQGKVIGLPLYDEHRIRFDFQITHPQQELPKKIRLSWYYSKQIIQSGEQWQFTVKLKKPHGYFNPNGFDYEQWLFTNRIGATGYIRNTPQPIKLSEANAWQGIDPLRQIIANQLILLSDNSPFIGVILALTIGDKSQITTEQWQIVRQTGVAHLLAISGLHIGLIASLIYYLSLKIASYSLYPSPQKIAAASAVIIALCYSALAGFSLPTQRAVLMLSIAMLSLLLQRNLYSSKLLCMTLLMVVIYDPFILLSASFYLSFSGRTHYLHAIRTIKS